MAIRIVTCSPNKSLEQHRDSMVVFVIEEIAEDILK